jgi:4-hydroxyphenylpyruvate dioxygenase
MKSPDNPMGTDGFEFVEFAAPDPQPLRALFDGMGFSLVGRHRSKDVTLHRQGHIQFIINAEPHSFASAFALDHGPSACAIAFRVHDAGAAFRRALSLGAKAGPATPGPMELNIPCIEGVGHSLIYLVDQRSGPSIYDVDFIPVASSVASRPASPSSTISRTT